MSLANGTRLDTYEIVARLGAGSMGEVYRARDTKLNRDVAVKVPPRDLAADPARRARFTREAHGRSRRSTIHTSPRSTTRARRAPPNTS